MRLLAVVQSASFGIEVENSQASVSPLASPNMWQFRPAVRLMFGLIWHMPCLSYMLIYRGHHLMYYGKP